MCLNKFYGSVWEKKVSFSPWRVKTRGASMFWSLRNNAVNQQLSAQQRTGVAGIWNDKSCRQKVGEFIYLSSTTQPHNSKELAGCCSELSWLPASPPGPAQSLAEWEPRLGAGLWCRDSGPAQARNQACEFHQHFTISKCILPHKAYWARTFSLLLSPWDIDLIMVGAFLTYRNKSAQERPSDFVISPWLQRFSWQ